MTRISEVIHELLEEVMGFNNQPVELWKMGLEEEEENVKKKKHIRPHRP